jgi:hypothetical protein
MAANKVDLDDADEVAEFGEHMVGLAKHFCVFGSAAVDAPVDHSQYGPRNQSPQSDTPGSE